MTVTPGPTPDVNLNLNIRGLSQSATVALNERSEALRATGRRIYKLGLGQSPFPVPSEVVEELRANAAEKDYLPVKGLPSLREAVADYHCRREDIERTADDILIGPGSKELMFLLQLVYYGDLIIPTPSWVSYAPQAKIIGRQVRWVPTTPKTGWALSPEELDRVCSEDPTRPRIVVLNYPSNPTGQTYDDETLQQLAAVARKYRLIVLSDEIYGELHHQGQHRSIASYYPEGTIISSGLSKWSGAGGWRLGTAAFPESLRWLQDAMATAASETFTSTSAPIQYAAVRAFRGSGEIEDYLFQSRRVLRTLGGWCAAALRGAGVDVPVPQGGFYLFPDFTAHAEQLKSRGITTGSQLCERLLDETGVAMLPASEFGCPGDPFGARLAYVDFDGARALAASRTVPADQELGESFLNENCQRMLAAVNEICNWLQA